MESMSGHEEQGLGRYEPKSKFSLILMINVPDAESSIASGSSLIGLHLSVPGTLP